MFVSVLTERGSLGVTSSVWWTLLLILCGNSQASQSIHVPIRSCRLEILVDRFMFWSFYSTILTYLVLLKVLCRSHGRCELLPRVQLSGLSTRTHRIVQFNWCHRIARFPNYHSSSTVKMITLTSILIIFIFIIFMLLSPLGRLID